jgi:transcriptional regulator with XRE-family HTH domain
MQTVLPVSSPEVARKLKETMGASPKNRSVKPNGEAISRLRQEKGWRVLDLAKKVGCDERTVANVERGANVYLVTLANFATALGVNYASLVAGGEPPPEPPKKEPRVELTVTLSIPFEELDQSEQLVALIEMFRRLVQAKDAIEVKGLMAGSTIITLEMSETDVRALITAFMSGKLDEMPIEAIRLPDDFVHGTTITREGTEKPRTGGTLKRFRPPTKASWKLPPGRSRPQPKKSKKPKPGSKQ